MAKNELVEKATNGAVSGDDVRSALGNQELLVPAVLGVAGAIAAVKGPSIVRGLTGSVEQKAASAAEGIGAEAAEGAKESIGGGLGGGMAGKMFGKLTGLGGGDQSGGDQSGGGKGGGGGKKTRRLPIQRWTDVAVPVDQAYEAWTQFEQFPKFMHRILSIEQKSDDEISWQEKIWFSKRQWEGCIVERRENDRIVWKTVSGMSHKGIVSFHPLSERLTRVMVEMEFEPNGMVEKMASGLRFVKRAVQADLARFKAFVEMQDAEGIEYRSADDQKQDAGEEQDADERDGEDQARGNDDEQRAARQTRRTARKTRSASSGSSSSNGQGRSSTSASSSNGQKRSSASAKSSNGRKRTSAKRRSAKRSAAN